MKKSKQFGRNVVRSFDNFELIFRGPFHFSFQSHHENHWSVALMHTDHHVVAWIDWKNNQWEWSWRNPDNEKDLVVLPEDTIDFLNNRIAIEAFKQFQAEELNTYIKYTSSYLGKLRRQLKITLPKDISKQKQRLAGLRGQLKQIGL